MGRFFGVFMKNKDGLEAGKPVDFQTMMRVNKERENTKDEPPKPKSKAVKNEPKTTDTKAGK